MTNTETEGTTKMTLKPYHKHELLHDYSAWPSNWREVADAAPVFRADWFCPFCNREIKGPPWVVGDYVVTSTYRYRVGRLWRVYMLAAFAARMDGSFYPRDSEHVFESKRKRDALKHARELERGRLRLLRQIERGDAKLLADIHRDVKRVEREERDA